MPGHKGKSILGFEKLDITEIKGADSLFEADSIIKQSEQNASTLFGCDTYYSTEGSSLCIRAMLYLCTLYAKKKGVDNKVLATRNVHKTFLSAVSLLDIDVEFLQPVGDSYLSCELDSKKLDVYLKSMSAKPVALYVTSPDYLGNMLDIEAISAVCKKHGVLLLVDNAHGAYLKFLKESQHPVDLGAAMCVDSAHKTLPVLTGGAYLHIAQGADRLFADNRKRALSLFASTSPSYLILQSLDICNRYLSDNYRQKLHDTVERVDNLKRALLLHGYVLGGNEPLKITLSTKAYGYTGIEFAQILRDNFIECEFCDNDYVVLMLNEQISDVDIQKLHSVMLSIKKRDRIDIAPPLCVLPKRAMTVREAVMSVTKTVDVDSALNCVAGMMSIGCPPAVPVVCCGEIIDEEVIKSLKYYGITKCDIIE